MNVMPAASPDCAVAIDLGGTRFRIALIDRKGVILDRVSEPTPASAGRQAVIDRLIAETQTLLQRAGNRPIVGLGIGIPGPVDPWTGVVSQTPNLVGWYDVPVKAILEAELGLSVQVGNDANLAAIGEHTFGAGQGFEDLIYLTVSTGVGGGIITGGRILLGSAGLAAEPGHMTVVPEGPRCGCGNRGCLETLASGTAIGRLAQERLAAGEASILAALPPAAIDAVAVVAAAERGDPLAADVMNVAMGYLGIGIANLIHLFNPRAIVIGGGVSRSGDLLFEPVRRIVHDRCMPDYLTGLVITVARLGDDAGLLGSAALAFRPEWHTL